MNLRRIATGAGALLLAAALTACGGSDASSTKAAADGGTPPAVATDKPQAKVGKVNVVYGEVSKNPDLQPVRDGWAESKMLEGLGETVTGMLKLPDDITITASECGQENAFWQPDEKQMTLCYELMPWFTSSFEQLYETEQEVKDKSAGALTGIFFHELGHAAVSLYDLPITGKEDDAVDQLATFLLTEGGEEQMAIDFGEFWQILGAGTESLADLDFADEHSTDEQRAYSVMCLVVGSNPEKFTEYLVGAKEDGLLPESRAERCPAEYEQVKKSWSTLLEPHLNNA